MRHAARLVATLSLLVPVAIARVPPAPAATGAKPAAASPFAGHWEADLRGDGILGSLALAALAVTGVLRWRLRAPAPAARSAHRVVMER